MVIRNYTLVAFFSLFAGIVSNAQVSQSCDCIVDTSGLANYLSTLNLNENQPLSFEVENSSSTFAVLHGFIDASTPNVVQNFVNTYPNVTTLVFMQVPGSMNDDANLIASQALRNKGYKHYIPAVNAYAQDAFIASGGVDMFVGGITRVVDVNAEVGVHAWGDGSVEATDFPVGHSNHLPYINYYVNMGFTQQEAEDFYYFTINAAPASGIHFMTESELNQYKTRTCTYSSTPTYSVTQNGAQLTANLAGASYQWLDCDNGYAEISGETTQTFNASANGNYAVEITESGCMDTSACFMIDAVSIQENGEQLVSVYPNPVNNVLWISGAGTAELVEVIDCSGKVLGRSPGAPGSVNVTDLNHGFYWVRIQFQDRVEVLPFVK